MNMTTTLRDTSKITNLKSQMKDMTQDYDNMIKAREESKKQLESKFNEVDRYIR
jgi:hypothetical protein